MKYEIKGWLNNTVSMSFTRYGDILEIIPEVEAKNIQITGIKEISETEPKSVEVINDQAMFETITNDIQNGFGLDRDEAKAIAKDQGWYIIECMWTEYNYSLDHLMKHYEEDKEQ